MLVAVHDKSTKVVESLRSKNLGEEVSIVLGGLDIDRLHDVLVTKASDPLLTAVDVLKVGLEASAFDKGDCSRIVNAKFEGLRKVHAKLLNHIG